MLFIFPGIAVIAALGVNNLINLFNNKYIQWATAVVIVFLMILPLRHIIASHPYEYIYYNNLSGGVKKAYGKYEMDYFYHTLREGSEWLIENKINKMDIPKGKKIIVASNLSINTAYYFRHLKDKVKIIYIRYYERGNKDWDFAILANSYINPYQLKRHIWPPANTIKTFTIDKVPVCAILERKNRNDLRGYELLTEGDYPLAIEYFKQAVKDDKNYEMEYLNMAKAYLDMGDNNHAIQTATECMKLYPNYDRALNIIGMAYMNKNELENAFQVFKQNMKYNPKNVVSYYYIGLIYAQTDDYETALKYLDDGIKINARYKPNYFLAARIYELQGRKEDAERIINYVNSLP